MNAYLEQIISIAQQAGAEIAKVYHQQSEIVTHKKADASFVTEADIKAHNLIVEKIRTLTPDIPLISEEIAIPPFQERQHWEQYWSIDPLDGTYEFVHRNGEFVVSIALIQNHFPILGVLYLPLTGTTYFAAKNHGAFKMDLGGKAEKIHVRSREKQESTCLVVSRRRNTSPELTVFLSRFDQYTLIEHSSAFKFCLIAEGKADIYPRFGTTHEWDIAAGQCIVEEAGGSVLTLSGERLCYNTQESLKNPYFLAIGDLKYELDVSI